MSNTDRIREELRDRFRKAISTKQLFVKVHAGELHESVEFKDGSHHNQMPSCCNVMHEFKGSNDTILASPPKGQGSSLLISYVIPRLP